MIRLLCSLLLLCAFAQPAAAAISTTGTFTGACHVVLDDGQGVLVAVGTAAGPLVYTTNDEFWTDETYVWIVDSSGIGCLHHLPIGSAWGTQELIIYDYAPVQMPPYAGYWQWFDYVIHAGTIDEYTVQEAWQYENSKLDFEE